jgi:hypothetical protein
LAHPASRSAPLTRITFDMEPAITLFREFSSQIRVSPIYDGEVSPNLLRIMPTEAAGIRKMALTCSVGLLVFVVLAKLLLFLMPVPHVRLHYMVAGTAATLVTLVVMFARVSFRRAIWAAAQRKR